MSHRRGWVQWLKSLFGAGPKRGGPRPKQNEKSAASGVPCQICTNVLGILCAFRHVAYFLDSTFCLWLCSIPAVPSPAALGIADQACHAVTDSQLAGSKARHAAGMEAWRLLSAHAWLLLGVRSPVLALARLARRLLTRELRRKWPGNVQSPPCFLCPAIKAF